MGSIAANKTRPPDVSRGERILSLNQLRKVLSRTGKELSIFFAFGAMTILMTWPWILHIRDAALDTGDTYFSSWLLWWDYHQTFNNPFHLFDANILFPYRYTLAFSEHSYGIALFFFPLYALGLRPLTVNGVATLSGFALCGYGAFRLARTMTGSSGAAWVAGVAFAFVPYRFHHLPHIMYLFAVWIPLLLEALVLYVRVPNRRRAVWLGIAFFMNALTSIHWFLLTSIPLALVALFLVSRGGFWRQRSFWIRASIALGIAFLALLPFLIPYLQVASLYGLVREPAEAKFFSARPIHWLTVDWQNRVWKGLGSSVSPYQTELALFPGLSTLLLATSALFLRSLSVASITALWRRCLVGLLNAFVVICAIVALLVIGYGVFRPHFFGVELFHAANPWSVLFMAAAAIVVKCFVARPRFWQHIKSWREKTAPYVQWRREAIVVGLIWVVLGFIGSFGMNFFFHRLLFDYVPLFRSIRVPARWSMICFVGLSLLAGVGAMKIIARFSFAQSRTFRVASFALIVSVLLFEQRAAPLVLVRGDVDPDAVTLRLSTTKMSGGIVELPAGVGHSNYLYTLRAADHAKPLVNGVSGFSPPIIRGVEEMSLSRPIPGQFLDLLEAIPVSYVVVHYGALPAENREAVEKFLSSGVASGRLRFVERFGEQATSDDLFLVTKTEPEAANKLTATK